MGSGKPGPSDQNIRRSLQLRQAGWSWPDIAAELGYKTAFSAQSSCSRYKHAESRKIDARLAALPF